MEQRNMNTGSKLKSLRFVVESSLWTFLLVLAIYSLPAKAQTHLYFQKFESQATAPRVEDGGEGLVMHRFQIWPDRPRRETLGDHKSATKVEEWNVKASAALRRMRERRYF
jgi:hypothetical protein